MNGAIPESPAGLHWSADGLASLSGPLLDYANRLDEVLCGWALALGGSNHCFPGMIAARDLAPIGYLRSFPHLVTLATCVARNESALKSFADRHGTTDRIDASDSCLEPVRQLLTPAACYHFYPQFAGRNFDEPLYLTTRGQCFRREDHYLPLQRQWCFQMRELVCIGGRAAIGPFVDTLRDSIAGLVETLGICAHWRSATDSFFDPHSDPKALAQRIEPSKQELQTTAGLAIASVNRHRSFFGESYRIRYRGEPAQSACVAFGIERWLHALLETHGSNVAVWPAPGDTACP